MTNEELKLFDKFSGIALRYFLQVYEIQDAKEFRNLEAAADAYGVAESMIVYRRIFLKVGIDDRNDE